ncbi:MAG: COX15/CtaA family protein [Balneolaceae bacterium]
MMKLNLYQKTALTTVIATLVLILIGGLVRAVGAGLGCPDWPKCFGMWIPPTSAAELPPGYDASQFNPLHTWLEYVNRLAGVIIGIFITATFVISLRYRKSEIKITIASGVAFILVLFQGWLGGQVVRSELSAGMITIHMITAMVIVNTLLYACFKAMSDLLITKTDAKTKRILLWISGVLLFMTLVQLVMGTQVREAVDVSKNILSLPRERWIDSIGWLYEVHRSFSWLIVLLGGLLVFFNGKYEVSTRLVKTGWVIGGLILLQIIVGVGMERLDMPGLLQMVHLVSVTLLICTEFLYMLILGFSKQEV